MKECKKCGYENDNGVRYCAKCGFKLEIPEVKNADNIIEETIETKDIKDNRQEKNDSQDVYDMSLAVLVQEYRHQNRELVPTKKWYKSCVMLVLPIIGCVYFLIDKNENENIKNFNKAARVVSIIYNMCLIIIAAIFMLSFTSDRSKDIAVEHQSQTEFQSRKEIQSQTEDESEKETESKIYLTPVKQTEIETTTVKSKLTDGKGFIWDKDAKTFDFEINGKVYRIPTSNPTDYKKDGWKYLSTTLNPNDTTESFIHFENNDGADLKVYFKNADSKMETVRLYMLLPEKCKTTFFGLKSDSTYEDVLKVFADGKIATDTYKKAEKYGEVAFYFDDFKFRVGIKDAYIRFLYVEREK